MYYLLYKKKYKSVLLLKLRESGTFAICLYNTSSSAGRAIVFSPNCIFYLHKIFSSVINESLINPLLPRQTVPFTQHPNVHSASIYDFFSSRNFVVCVIRIYCWWKWHLKFYLQQRLRILCNSPDFSPDKFLGNASIDATMFNVAVSCTSLLHNCR